MRNFLLKFTILAVMLLGLPLLGVFLAGQPVGRYLEFPPQTRYVRPAPFSWPAFAAYALLIAAVVFPLIIRGWNSYRRARSGFLRFHSFPWWGWVGLIMGTTFWCLAWTRFSWLAPFQPHTFTPLWLAFILVFNALCWRRTGHCLLTDRPGYFLLLFPASALFWWFFEYLNRFVQNWFYVGSRFGPWSYILYATPPFSSVLPAVLSTREWLGSFPWIGKGFNDFQPFTIPRARLLAGITLLMSAAGLAGIGIWPNYLFPLLWISPLLIIVSMKALMKERHILSEMADGNWNLAIASALAALFCGFFWEMWNYFSLAKWKYSVPFVHRFPIFEMPLLGYAGYLPFGLECAVVAEMLAQLGSRQGQSKTAN
ncbi:MAG: hypothetical protein JSW39_16790 [Desulfobacterales bacterium]|nr:MAG: hypothetical protein JSW39_16790 [Desulfobacterales bacterium]